MTFFLYYPASGESLHSARLAVRVPCSTREVKKHRKTPRPGRRSKSWRSWSRPIVAGFQKASAIGFATSPPTVHRWLSVAAGMG
jgi:hypothetical protein